MQDRTGVHAHVKSEVGIKFEHVCVLYMIKFEMAAFLLRFALAKNIILVGESFQEILLSYVPEYHISQ